MSIDPERSKIKPDLAAIKGKAKKDVKTVYNTMAYDSYTKEGFQPPEPYDRSDHYSK